MINLKLTYIHLKNQGNLFWKQSSQLSCLPYGKKLRPLVTKFLQMASLTTFAFCTVYLSRNFSYLEDSLNINVYGSQSGCNGPSNGSEVFQQLKSQSYPFVQFKEEHFNSSYVEGGTCTAMALDMAARIETLCPPKEAKNFKKFADCIKSIGQNYRKSNQIFRDRQAAFNSITVKQLAPDLAKSKIEALISYHLFSLDQVTPDLASYDQKDVAAHLDIFSKAANNMNLGTFLVRNLKLANNHKAEHHGHSTLLIKSIWGSLYYDPNLGVNALLERDIGRELLHRFLQPDRERFGIDNNP